jgi:3-oxoacyl-[acyl-carrier protein] reductase
MELGLADKVALVGGGGRGLGRAAAEVLAAEGAAVAIFGRRIDALEAAATQIARRTGAQVLPIPADVTSAADCERVVAVTVAELGGLDVLVTNMGGPPYGGAADRSDDEWQRAWELVTLSVIRLCRAAADHMAGRGGGSIVNVTTPGVHQLIAGTALSTVARMATTGFAKYLATELAPQGIRVNNVLPGWISTQRVSELAAAEAAERRLPVEAIYEEQIAAIPMGRFGEPVEVAEAIAFLASSRSRYITGTNMRIDGGWSTATAL